MENTESNKELLMRADAFNKKVQGTMKQKKRDRFSIPLNVLKWLAMIAILCQNINIAIFEKVLVTDDIGKLPISALWKLRPYSPSWKLFANKEYADALNTFIDANATMYNAYLIFMVVGCMTLPLICYLLVNSFLKSEKKLNTILAVGVCAVAAEIPYDLVTSDKFYNYENQNMFFGLFMGLAVIACMDIVLKKYESSKLIKYSLSIIIVFLGMFIGIFGNSYFLCFPIIIMVAMYIFKDKKLFGSVIGCLALTYLSLYYICSFLSLIPIYFHNGKEDKKMNYILLAFYPIHLIILYIIAKNMGLY